MLRAATILAVMPLIVVGADTEAGEAILRRIGDRPEREVRVFVSDEATALDLRNRGFKVALGDLSDSGHIEAAATRCFSAVLIAEAAIDGREVSFARDSDEVLRGWAEAVGRSKVSRVIWVGGEPQPDTSVPEVVSVDPRHPDLAERVVALDDAHSVP